MNKIDYNKFTNKQLREIFDIIPDFVVEPFRHQYLTLAQTIGDELSRVCYFHDIGTGKTLTALWTTYLWESKKILVVCPYSAFPAWNKNIMEYTGYSHVFLTGTPYERKYKLSTEKDVYIINYEGLKTIYGELIPGSGWKIEQKYFTDNFDCVIFDEVHKCKSFSTLQSKICYQLSHRATHAIGLTGTPIGGSFLDLWGEMRVVDLGASLGTNYYAFRWKYFKKGFYDWYIKKGVSQEILEKIAPITTSFSREECIDLPEKMYETRSVNATEEQKELEKDIREGLNKKYKEGTLNLKNVLNLSQKLLQISGGFLYLKGGTKVIHSNPKLRVLDDIISETRGKLLVFHQFQEEGRIIEEWCKHKKIKFAALRGEIKEKQEEYNRFVSNPKTKIMIAHPTSGGESLDFTVCSVVVFYSNGYSSLQRKQAEGRIHRVGQTKGCLYIDIKLEGSIDEVVCKRIKDKEKLCREVLEYIREK